VDVEVVDVVGLGMFGGRSMSLVTTGLVLVMVDDKLEVDVDHTLELVA
jgi:hypothetical protein